MLAYLDGLITHKGSDYAIIDVNGIGFKVYTTTSVLAELKNKARLYVHWHISENSMALFGFLSQPQVDMFESLISVSGVGPKAAIAIMEALSYEEILMALAYSDDKALSRAKGIGAKTAQRIIMELKDKMHIPGEIRPDSVNKAEPGSLYGQALEALASLGYSHAEAANMLEGLDVEGQNLEGIIKEALKRS